jgi:hypothetical protein
LEFPHPGSPPRTFDKRTSGYFSSTHRFDLCPSRSFHPSSDAFARHLSLRADLRDFLSRPALKHRAILMRTPTRWAWPKRLRPPGFIVPCQPILARAVPAGDGWLHELKHDGFRIIVPKDGDDVRLWSRNGRDLSVEFVAITAAVLARSPATGEAVAHCPNGRRRTFMRLIQSLMRAGLHSKPARGVPRTTKGGHEGRLGLFALAAIRDRSALLRAFPTPSEQSCHSERASEHGKSGWERDDGGPRSSIT